MSGTEHDAPLPRVLGDLGDPAAGATVMVTVGIHGNEPGGVRAARRVLRRLADEGATPAGRLVVCTGNIGALHRRQRFLRRDLNRGWFVDQVAVLRARPTTEAEDREQLEIAELFDTLVREAQGPIHLIDLHSFSADGPPFVILGDTLRNRRLAFPLGAPVILGLEETVPGTLLEYAVELGHIAVVVEGGRHEDEETVDHLEAALWSGLASTGLLPEATTRRLGRTALDSLRTTTRDLPRAVEARYRHGLGPEDGFVMRPGYVNFQPVERGEVLAQDRRGDVQAPESGVILMPLYQLQGEDGFFLARPVHMFWLHLSALCRRLRLERVLVPLLPGVRRHEQRPRTLLVDPRIARWLTVEIFRLLGFRPHGQEGRHLLFTRRRDRAPAPA